MNIIVKVKIRLFLMIASTVNDCIKKQRQKHNNLVTIGKAKLKGNPWALQEPLACSITQTQTLTRMDKGAIEDYYYVKWMKLTHLLSKKNKTLNLGAPFVHLPLLCKSMLWCQFPEMWKTISISHMHHTYVKLLKFTEICMSTLGEVGKGGGVTI